MIIETKIILLPLVIWAIAALYTVEIVRPKNTDRYWVVLGIFTGAILSVALFIYGCLHLGLSDKKPQKGGSVNLMEPVNNNP